MTAHVSRGGDQGRSGDLQRARSVATAWQRELPDVPTRSIALVWLVKAVAVALRNGRAGLLDQLGIDAATLDLLSTLRRRGEPYRLTTRQLAERCLVSAGAISQRITRAERDGLVLRNPGEGRSVEVALTERGHQLVERTAGKVLAADDDVTAEIGDEDLGRLEQLLSAWLASMKESGGAAGS
ncbi:MarR family winged helix-turn-helix transcriptional regulator [Ruania zhangjianzhongii]|uniref:MarR family winged helix-turn-helix transcriptional regulator n=1 Tax=Ruania zhangjianzhongii TaxID=2603206 RepID=UPI0011C7404D|nr:MarR family transcriptional regulator [Ruania zhangjianzhongii]